ncbi:MAG: MTH1187 family thiamine-binding protein [Thermoplasmata archaeon]|nr:MAG: MTH1187 family thiamine-binding protein [Thermoplasmata archaeon]
MIIAQISITPIGAGTSVGDYVRVALDEIRNSRVRYELNAMATVVEVESLDKLFEVVKRSHEAVIKKGAKRVITEIKIDDRRDKDASIESKIKTVEK